MARDKTTRTGGETIQPVWLANLVSNLRDRRVAILHGNVRDIYIEKGRMIHSDLTGLLQRVAGMIGQTRGTPFHEMVFFDTASGEHRLPLSPKGQAPTGTSSRNPNASPGLLDATPPANSPPDTGTPRNPSRRTPDTVIATWFRELTSEQESRIAVLYYLDKLIPYSTNYADTDRQLLVWLERIVNKIAPHNRLILVALQDSMVPVELYTNAPNAFVQAIPMPDADDRETYLHHTLGDLEGDDRISKDRFRMLGKLTDGLYLRDLANLCTSIHMDTDFSEANLRRLLNRYRFGEKKDFFGQLDVTQVDVENVVAWFQSNDKDKGGVKGQTEAVIRISQMLTIARAGLSGIASGTVSKPKGVLFFAGPSGVGKTLVAKELAKFLFADETAYLRFDMSEMKEEHTVSKLIGSPPGYVGSEQGGMLTNGVRQKPFSVVLFDEIEKAHAKIMDIFLQILDEGRLTDSRGQTVFFTEAIIVFTSNLGTRTEHKERERLDAIRADQTLTEPQRRDAIRAHFIQCVEDYFRSQISRP
ncbi:MAG: AAA family ATPase, partial [Kiritimatiellia bacterium]